MNQRVKYLLGEWILPPRLFSMTKTFLVDLRSQFSIENKALLARNKVFYAKESGRRCFIIGNGPSLAKQDLSPLANEITICQNWFNKHPIIKTWRPTYYCAADPVREFAGEDIAGMLQNLDAQAYFFIIDTRSYFEEHNLLPKDKIFFVDTVAGRDISSYNRIDLSRSIPLTRLTTHLALMVAIYLGCNPIYLLGMDHDWLAHRSIMNHFYDPWARERSESPNNFALYSYKTSLDGMLRNWILYEELDRLAKNHGCEIYNATGGGFLDVFPLADYNSLF